MQDCDFDSWRERYDTMTLTEHAAFYDKLHADHPIQRHFCREDVLEFFGNIPLPVLYVSELGGFDGELAGLCLSRFTSIAGWDNYDLARVETKVSDSRYSYRPLTEQLWNSSVLLDSNVFVASHVIEHLSERDLLKLLCCIRRSEYIYLDAPLHETDRTDWTGATAAHKLDLSWRDVDALVCDLGFHKWEITGTAHCFRKRV